MHRCQGREEACKHACDLLELWPAIGIFFPARLQESDKIVWKIVHTGPSFLRLRKRKKKYINNCMALHSKKIEKANMHRICIV